MAIQTTWLDEEKTIMLWTFSEDWTLYELRTNYERANAMALQMNHWTRAIVDLRKSRLPQHVFSVIVTLARSDIPNHDIAVVVTSNLHIKTLTELLERVPSTQGKFKVVATMDEALAFCTERRELLKDKQIPM